MYKVTIDSTDAIICDGKKIGTFINFSYSDFNRNPNMLKNYQVKLDNGNPATLVYGGFIDGKFQEVCHLRCRWGSSCFKYRKQNCQFRKDFTNIGFYAFEVEKSKSNESIDQLANVV
jgi:hypothetical protein